MLNSCSGFPAGQDEAVSWSCAVSLASQCHLGFTPFKEPVFEITTPEATGEEGF